MASLDRSRLAGSIRNVAGSHARLRDGFVAADAAGTGVRRPRASLARVIADGETPRRSAACISRRTIASPATMRAMRLGSRSASLSSAHVQHRRRRVVAGFDALGSKSAKRRTPGAALRRGVRSRKPRRQEAVAGAADAEDDGAGMDDAVAPRVRSSSNLGHPSCSGLLEPHELGSLSNADGLAERAALAH